MKICKLSGSTAIALVLFCSTAQAITPEEVWENWQAFATSGGNEITIGNTAKNGNVLEVTGLVAKSANGGGSTTGTIDKLSFTDRGDGTVEITMSESIPFEMTMPPGGEGVSAMKMVIVQQGLSLIASGTTEATNYEFSAPTSSVKVTDMKSASGEALDTTVDVVLSGSSGKYVVEKTGEVSKLDSAFGATSMDVSIVANDPEADSTFKGTMTFADVKSSSKGGFVGAELMKEMVSALNAGFTTDTDLSFGATAMDFDMTEAGAPTKILLTATGGGFDVALAKEGMSYGTSLNGLDLSLTGANIPFPEVKVSMAESAFNFAMPISKGDAPQDFSVLTKLVDLKVSDDIWGLVDPAGTLPRDPATVIFDAKGTAKLLADIMDPAAQAQTGSVPGEVNTLDLTQVLVKAVGAEIAATGALTFDNTDLVTFQGMPAPTGKINVDIKGVNALIDNLIAMGLVPEDQAMGARMMMGIFARPGEGPDALVSEIEFKDKGIFANGQQLQ
jgi:hypothetical protein